MMMDSFFRTLRVLVILALMPFGMAQAQDNMPRVSQPAPTIGNQMAPVQSMPPDNEEITILKDEYAGKYNISTLENLSKLYWRLGAFDMEDDMAVTNYIKINDCKIYSEYLNDDMEWNKILVVMKDYIKKNLHTFPLNYQFVLPLHLGRYDPERGGFPLIDKTGFLDVKRIEVDSIDYSRDICFDSHAIKDYPKSMTILLPEPFTLDFIKLDEHVAQAYILRKKSDYAKLSDQARLAQYEREAYLRLRVTFSQYHGNIRGEGLSTMSILYGKIDGYEIFEDSNQTRMMLSVNMNKEREAALSPQMSTPSTNP